MSKAPLRYALLKTRRMRVRYSHNNWYIKQGQANSSVNFVVRPWVKSADYWDVYFDITANVKLSLDQSGISIPYPQRDVHMIPSNA